MNFWKYCDDAMTFFYKKNKMKKIFFSAVDADSGKIVMNDPTVYTSQKYWYHINNFFLKTQYRSRFFYGHILLHILRPKNSTAQEYYSI